MAKSKRIYQPMEKVIVTQEQPARIGYVVANRKGNTGLYGKGKWEVRITFNLQDAQEHRYKLISYDHVQPYKEELWQAFERLEFKKMELTNMFYDLKQGKIPLALQPVTQGDLFSIENTRPIGRE